MRYKLISILIVGSLAACTETPEHSADSSAATSSLTNAPEATAAEEALSGEADRLDAGNRAGSATSVGLPSDRRLAVARGISTDELHDANRHYGYTEDDQEFLAEHGVSEGEARAMESVMCSKGVDC